MCYDDSDMPVFTDTATWICMKRKQPVLTWNVLIKGKKNSTAPPHSVWSAALIKHKKREHFYISNLLHFKSSAVCWLCLVQTSRQRIAQGAMTQVTRGWLQIRSARKPIITGNMRVSELHCSQLKCDLGFWCWNGVHMKYVASYVDKLKMWWATRSWDELLAISIPWKWGQLIKVKKRSYCKQLEAYRYMPKYAQPPASSLRCHKTWLNNGIAEQAQHFFFFLHNNDFDSCRFLKLLGKSFESPLISWYFIFC